MSEERAGALSGRAINQPTIVDVRETRLKVVVALFPLIGCVAIVGLRSARFDIYKNLFAEDRLFEYLSSAMYFGAAAAALVITLAFRRNGRLMLAAAYALATLGLLFVAGEEISWGQRILNFETPAALLERNTQQELTLHNLEPVQRHLHAAYIFVGTCGAFLWLLTLPPIASVWTRMTPYVVPGWYLATYFLPVFIFYTHLEVTTPETAWFQDRHPDQEPGEFMMALGFLLFVLNNRYRQILDLSLDKSRSFNVAWRSPD